MFLGPWADTGRAWGYSFAEDDVITDMELADKVKDLVRKAELGDKDASFMVMKIYSRLGIGMSREILFALDRGSRIWSDS